MTQSGHCRSRDRCPPKWNGSRIVAVIGELVAAGVPQHVDVNREAKLGPFANVLDLAIEGVRRAIKLRQSKFPLRLIVLAWASCQSNA
jgi:hypothetical protein